MKFPKHFLSVNDLAPEQFLDILGLARDLKLNRKKHNKFLESQIAGILTTKPSLRTRLSFEIGLLELGAKPLFIRNEEVGLGERESYADIIRVLERYLDLLIVRTHDHNGLLEMSKYSSIPIINALTSEEHPCQILADFLTIQEKFGELKNLKLTYIGDGNNVCHSLMLASAMLGVEFTAITPPGYEPSEKYINLAMQNAQKFSDSSKNPQITNNIQKALEADILYTDVWVSMGESADNKSQSAFENYKINETLLKNKNIPVLHCLPAHKDQEISENIFEANSKLIFDQAENRLHAQKALMIRLNN